MLGFVPTSADAAFEATLAFYKRAFTEFPKERDMVLTELFKVGFAIALLFTEEANIYDH